MLPPHPDSIPETPQTLQQAEESQAPTVSTGDASTIPAEPPAKLPTTSVNDMLVSDSPQATSPSIEASVETVTTAPKKQSAKKKKGKTESDPMLLDIAVLKLDKNTATRLQEAGITTIGDLVPNRSKYDLTDNPLLNRKLRREIEARLKTLKVALNAKPIPKTQIKSTPNIQIPPLPQEDLKIGEFVRLALQNLSASGYEFKPSEIDEMCSSEWSIKTFHTKHTFMKRYTPGVTDNKGEDGYVRYWSEPFTFGGDQVLISKEWFEGNQRNYFTSWYNALK